jgi:hypothetical protein
MNRVLVSMFLGANLSALAACASAPKHEEPPAPAVAELVDAPMAIVLEGNVDREGRWALRATLTVAASVSVPPVLRIVLPPGAELMTGNLKESLPAPGVEATHIRRFLVAGATAPVRVVAGAVAGGAGVTVGAHWPAREGAVPIAVPPASSIPPTPVRDVPVERVVPLD